MFASEPQETHGLTGQKWLLQPSFSTQTCSQGLGLMVFPGSSPSILENKFDLFLAIYLSQMCGTWNSFNKQILIQHPMC